jgi:hypothetical protein
MVDKASQFVLFGQESLWMFMKVRVWALLGQLLVLFAGSGNVYNQKEPKPKPSTRKQQTTTKSKTPPQPHNLF